MAAPTTAIQISMAMKSYQKVIDSFRDEINEVYFRPLFRLMQKRIFLQRPYTDDMIQMLVDLGIEPPENQPISYDGITLGSTDDPSPSTRHPPILARSQHARPTPV